jgi:hypothetical protein
LLEVSRSHDHRAIDIQINEKQKMYVKSSEMKMDEIKHVQYIRLVTGCSESSLRVVGHMTKELLKLETLKNIENVCKIV